VVLVREFCVVESLVVSVQVPSSMSLSELSSLLLKNLSLVNLAKLDA
jgi:hypothetical protein